MSFLLTFGALCSTQPSRVVGVYLLGALRHSLLVFTPEDLRFEEAQSRRILPTRSGIFVMCAAFCGMLYVLVDLSVEVGSPVLLYLFAPPPLLGLAVCGFYLSPWGARRFRRKAARRLAGDVFRAPDAAGHLPAWTLSFPDSFPQSRKYLVQERLSPFEVECAMALVSELDPEEHVSLSVFVERIRGLS